MNNSHSRTSQTTDATSYAAFISYATENIQRAEAICASLEAKGFICWMAPRDIRAGYEYADEIVRGIELSRCMVVVLSEAANDSPFVRREVERAVSKKKPVFPVRIEDVLPSPGLELFISATHWIDAWGSRFTEQVDKLARDLSGVSVATKPSWRARLKVWKRRASEYSLKGAAVLAVLAILFFGGKALIDQLPSNPTSADSNAGTATSRTIGAAGGRAVAADDGAKTQSSSGVQSTDSAASRTVVAETPAPVTSSALRDSYKQRALTAPFWLQCDEWFCSIPRLNTFFAAVRRISYGESRDRLDRTIDIGIPAGASTASALQEIAGQYVVDYLPIRPGVDSVFSRLDFYDGTQSEIKPARIDGAGRFTMGVALVPTESPAGKQAPALFAGYTLGEAAVRFAPDVAPETESVLYSFDEGGFHPAAPAAAAQRNRPARGYRFEGDPTRKIVRLELRGKNGEPVGPFRYNAEEAASLIVNTMKGSLLSDLYSLIKCSRFGFSFSERSIANGKTSADPNVRRETARLTSLLQSSGLEFVTRGPTIVCVADWNAHSSKTRGYLGDWAAVREIRFGTRSGRLGDNVRNTLEVADALQNKIPRGRDFTRLWHVILPANAEGVYAQLVFRDGTSSPEFRVQIEEIRL